MYKQSYYTILNKPCKIQFKWINDYREDGIIINQSISNVRCTDLVELSLPLQFF